jgi:type VI protein secretion system component Hcp
MTIRKLLIIILLALIFITGKTLTGEDGHYYINIPDVPGEVQTPGFEMWIQCLAVQYRLPGVPSPTALLKRPPEKKRGMLTAEEVGKPFGSFSKPPDKADPILYKAYNDKRSFPQWEFALCTPAGETYMAFIFKDVVISAIRERNNKQYITFKYEKVIWNYTGVKK